MTSDLVKSRNHLIITSCAILAVIYGDALLPSEITVSTLGIVLQNADALYWGVCGFWLYFFQRFITLGEDELAPQINVYLNEKMLDRPDVIKTFFPVFWGTKLKRIGLFNWHLDDVRRRDRITPAVKNNNKIKLHERLNPWTGHKEPMHLYWRKFIRRSASFTYVGSDGLPCSTYLNFKAYGVADVDYEKPHLVFSYYCWNKMYWRIVLFDIKKLVSGFFSVPAISNYYLPILFALVVPLSLLIDRAMNR